MKNEAATAFIKMHGSGNDVVVVLNDDHAAPPARTRVRALADRRTGIGFDQLMWVTPSTDADCDAAYRIFNADGGEVEQCGNGVRCVARAWADAHAGAKVLRLASPAGIVTAEVAADAVRVSMGAPGLTPADLPFHGPADGSRADVSALGQDWPLWLVSMGNPHAVLIVDNCDTAPVAELGSALQQNAAFPRQVNVGFLQVRSRTHGRLRVFERGVGETAACGTGAAAAAVAGQLAGVFDHDVTLSLPGGELMVSWRRDGDPVWLSGPAETVFYGSIDL